MLSAGSKTGTSAMSSKIHSERSDEVDEMLPHYNFSGGVRGKYYKRFQQGTSLVLLEPEVSTEKGAKRMLGHYTARYVKMENGWYMGQLIEWPGVITQGRTFEECRKMLRDALNEMLIVYKGEGMPLPEGIGIFETINIAECECQLTGKN